ncbi:tumor necrosis factor receptor superfamily member 25 isoform X1 [Acipenser ruthenus]|uniref:tumor necrosis factor receptor superfamily member 25 isoform X1 n=1 Tax=Acipenser ruthenus TaxID=7906 RepID=UPI0027416C2E|nr:tumor necrosis factor receptor superfamily member 25 isoform X1 [Acipenser ruthenus]
MKTWSALLLLGLLGTLGSAWGTDTEPRSAARPLQANASTAPWVHRRGRRAGECANGRHRDEGSRLCCLSCPAGFYRHAPCTDRDKWHHCRQCQPGTFLEHSNYMRSCEKCDSCDESLLQVVVRTCTPSSRTQCGCPGGHYKSRDSLCRPCTLCQHRPVNSNCSGVDDTVCGDCLSGFYEDEQKVCQPYERQPGGSPLGAIKGGVSPLMYMVACLALVLSLLAAAGIRSFRHRRREQSVLHTGDSADPKPACPSSGCEGLVVISDGPAESEACVNAVPPCAGSQSDHRTPPCTLHPPPTAAPPLWCGSMLYCIIDVVPARRWKEFVRTLPLPDEEMERAELEAGPVLREQQYMMLKRWTQRQGAGLHCVYNTLHSMDLPDCTETLRERLGERERQSQGAGLHCVYNTLHSMDLPDCTETLRERLGERDTESGSGTSLCL